MATVIEFPRVINPGTVNEHREWRTRLGALCKAVERTLADDDLGIEDYHYRARKLAADRWVVEILDCTGSLGYL